MEPSELRKALGAQMINASTLGRSLRPVARAEPEEVAAKITEGADDLAPSAQFLLSALGTDALFPLQRYVEMYISRK